MRKACDSAAARSIACSLLLSLQVSARFVAKARLLASRVQAMSCCFVCSTILLVLTVLGVCNWIAREVAATPMHELRSDGR